MGRIIVTKTKISKTPYVMKESGNPLYSYEELCYYIKSRMALWVEEKSLEGLTEKMKEWGLTVDNLDHLSPTEAAEKIFEAGNYIKKEEIELYVSHMQMYAANEHIAIIKDKGDLYLSYGKIRNAYQYYWQAFSQMTGEEPVEWKASLYHNFGIVCCRFFYWREAKNWFALAIDAKDSEESRAGLELVLDMEKKGWSSDGSSVNENKLLEKQLEFVREIG
ncbi:MAG: hypothetical protein E7253_02170 [Lachnospiraceae bacterium]|nr:hypothetical protein [Lachnospiraceae bacterium]